MAEYQVIIDAAFLQALFQGDDGVKVLMEKGLNQVLQAQATEQLQADPYERTADRQGYRNGTRPRKLTTRVGTLTLRIPQLREGQLSTELFARYPRSEQALVLALMERVINGVSTRKITAIPRRALWDGVQQEHGIGPGQAVGPGRHGVEHAPPAGRAVPVSAGGCPRPAHSGGRPGQEWERAHRHRRQCGGLPGDSRVGTRGP